ncbi:MAG: trans-aconitate 2-methyltransferase [Gemmatimonadales bacterium]
MTEHSVSQHLRIEIRDYDETIRRFIPGYDRMIQTAVDEVARLSPILAVDLGAGTGALSERLLTTTDGTDVELLDVDPAMMAAARARLAPFEDRARFRLGSFHDPLPRVGAMMASLSLHHIREPEAKAAFFRRIADALEPGGVFVNADITIPAAGPDHDRLYRFWADHLVAAGIGEGRAWEHFAEWSGEDRYFPAEDELRWLAAAGLEAEEIWRFGPASVIAAWKAGR